MTASDHRPSPDSQVILETLKTAVNKALDKKRRLGEYAVVWSDNKPAFIGGEVQDEQKQLE